MNTLLTCFTIAILMPMLLAFASLRYRITQFGRVDSENPRAQASQLKEGGQRVVAAQKNAWEALMMFGGAVLMALTAGVIPSELANPAILFIVARILHAVFYTVGNAPLRSLSFVIAFGSVIWIIVKAFNV